MSTSVVNRARISLIAVVGLTTFACSGPTGSIGANGSNGTNGTNGRDGTNGAGAPTTGSIGGSVKDTAASPLAGVTVSTTPPSGTATTLADGSFTISNVTIGAYSVTASKAGYLPFTLTGVGVAASGATSVGLVLSADTNGPGTISGIITDSKKWPTPLAGVVVKVQGQAITATTTANGTFTLNGVLPGPVFLTATAPSASYLDGETRSALVLAPGGALMGVKLLLSSRPSDAATYVGVKSGCESCHSDVAPAHQGSAHFRSLTRIQRDASGVAVAGGFSRMLNTVLNPSRIVMLPLAGTISASSVSAAVTGAGTTFQTDATGNVLQAGDEIGYTPVGLGWTKIGTIQGVASDTLLTLSANATFAPGVTSQAGGKFGVKRLSRIYTHMLPEDANDIVAPAWPGVKATNPNYDANDPCIYGNAPSGGTCAAGGTTKYADGQVNVYLCNLKNGSTYPNDEYVQKFGGSSYTCADGAFYSGGSAPAVPMVRIDVIYGGQGDKDGSGNAHANMGVFKQRFQGRLADIKAAEGWSYTTGKNLDSLTLPIQFLESGDRTNGGYKMNGYHPTEQKFPGESWTQRSRTFSHACAGCHNVGLKIDWDMVTVTLPYGRDGAPNNSPFTFAAVKSYSFADENITCEQCHGPGSEHIATGASFGPGGLGIINPKHLTAEAERQMCGKCHAYDDATNATPKQDYGFEFPWNTDDSAKIGGGDYVPGVYEISTFFDNWDEITKDDEAYWDPVATGGRTYGQAHRQQYTMLARSLHTNNSYLKVTCTSCHDSHSQYLASTSVTSAQDDTYQFSNADFRDNVLCLSCHAGSGPLAGMPASGSFASISKQDVANIHTARGGSVTKNGGTVAPSEDELVASQLVVSNAVSGHMFARAHMPAAYDPLNEASPVGRCTSCHMPKVAKSGGYVTGVDGANNKALVEGDQASHAFDIIWPWQSNAMSRGGPTFQSGYYGQMVSATNVKYDLFGYMPNSCSKCHASFRQASLVCPDTATIWPTFWPFGEHRSDPYWSSCFTTSSAP
jgi:hypothetical protein